MRIHLRHHDVWRTGMPVLLCASLLWPALGRAQQPADPNAPAARQADGQPGYTLSVRAQIVQLDVFVRDGAGALVQGLKNADFVVTENGITQKVLAVESTTIAPASKPPVQIHSTAELDRLEPNAPVTVLVLDELSSQFQDQYFAEYSLEKYLSKQGDVLDQPMTLIARSFDRTMVLSDYTTSKKTILDALKHHAGTSDPRTNNANFNDVQTGAAFASLIEIAHATQGHPGHKNLVWVGRGLPSIQWKDLQPTVADELRAEVQKCINLLQSSRITLFGIDPAGVQGLSGSVDDTGTITLDDPFNDAVSFDALVKATGGLSLHGRNDVDHLIGDAVADGENFYTVTYRPTAPVDDDPKKFHSIKVTLANTTLTATSREGYYPGATQPAVAPFANDKGKLTSNTMFDLASASTGLMVFDAIPLTLKRGEPTPDQVEISFPAANLGLTLADGKMKGDVTLIALSYDGKGKLLSKDGRVVSLHLEPLAEGQAESRTVHLTTPMKSQIPVARVRIVVRSNSNGKLGAENVFVADRGSLKDHSTGLKPAK